MTGRKGSRITDRRRMQPKRRRPRLHLRWRGQRIPALIPEMMSWPGHIDCIVGSLQIGNMVLLPTPLWLPQGAVLTAEALQGRPFGHRKPTGPMSLPRAPWPCTLSSSADAIAAPTRSARRETTGNFILGDRGRFDSAMDGARQANEFNRQALETAFKLTLDRGRSGFKYLDLMANSSNTRQRRAAYPATVSD